MKNGGWLGLRGIGRFIRLRSMAWFVVVLMAWLVPVCAWAGGGKSRPPMTFRVHAETLPTDTEVFAMAIPFGDPPRNLVVEKVPLISEREVRAFYPFVGADGSYGVYFLLSPHGAKAWEVLTTTRRSGFVVVIYNGRAVARLRLGRPVRDGIVMVPQGLTEQEIAALERRYPVIGEAGGPAGAAGRPPGGVVPVQR